MDCPRCHVPTAAAAPACPSCAAPLRLPDDPPPRRLDRPLDLDRRFVRGLRRAAASPIPLVDEVTETLPLDEVREDASALPPQPTGAPPEGRGEAASLGARLAAGAIDLALALAVAAPGLSVAAGALPAGVPAWRAIALPAVALVALLAFAHAALAQGWMGATLGQRLLGLHVATAAGAVPGLAPAALRAALAMAGAAALGAGWWVAAFTSGRRALHDVLTGTSTVRAARGEAVDPLLSGS